MVDKGRCDNGFPWSLGACECECDKSCYVQEYLNHVNCKCRKRLIDKLVEKFDEDIDGNDMMRMQPLLVITCIMIMGISGVYFHLRSIAILMLYQILVAVGHMGNMNFGANKTLVEVIKEGAFGVTYFRDIYSGINGKWYRKSWKEFNELKNVISKYY